MKIYDEHGTQVGELERPGPVLRGGRWYEFIAYRFPKEGERFLNDCNSISTALCDYTIMPRWIASIIPLRAPEHLAAIGMRERDLRPVEKKPTPLRNEKELCRDCINRRDCNDYQNGRRMACSDFGFVKEKDV